MKGKLILVAFAAIFALASCNMKENVNSSFVVSPLELEFTNVGGDDYVTITTDLAWTAELTGDKIFSIHRTNGTGSDKLMVSAEANVEVLNKTATLRLTASNGSTAEVKLLIAAANPEFAVSPLKATVSPLGGIVNVTIKCNTAWTAESDANWVKTSQSSGTNDAEISVTIDERNPASTHLDKANLTIMSEKGHQAVLEITREGDEISIKGDVSRDVPWRGATIDLMLESNTSWTLTSNKSWAKLSASSGTGNQTVTVIVPENTDGLVETAFIEYKTKSGRSGGVYLYRYAGLSDCEGHDYPAAKIGSYVWMTENLVCRTYDTQSGRSGTLSYPNKNNQTDPFFYSGKTATSEYSGNLTEALREKLGGLYNRAAAKYICPNGWHLPTLAEWEDLAKAAGGYVQGESGETFYYVGSAEVLKAREGWYNFDGTDEKKFTALPSGYSLYTDANRVYYIGHSAYFQVDDASYGYVGMNALNQNISFNKSYSGAGAYGYSVRCVKNR